jgi:hypothetical protein
LWAAHADRIWHPLSSLDPHGGVLTGSRRMCVTE